MKDELRSWGLSLIGIGALHIVLASVLDPFWGVILILIGVLILIIEHRTMFLAVALALLLAAFSNIFLAESPGMWTFFGVLQVFWAVGQAQRFFHYGHSEEAEEEERQQEGQSDPVEAQREDEPALLSVSALAPEVTAATPRDRVEGSARPSGYLTLQSGPRAGVVFPLGADTAIGRSGSDNDIVLESDRVSRHHARVRRSDEAFTLSDLGSTNGAWLMSAQRQERIQGEYTLLDGDEVGIGSLVLRFTHQEPERVGHC